MKINEKEILKILTAQDNNFILTGGYAIKIYLKKFNIDREIKDVDILIIDKNTNEKRLYVKKINIENSDFYVDIGYNFNFEFLLPTKNDINKITYNDFNFNIVKPEFLIAFKSFSLIYLRNKEIEDSLNLINNLSVNPKLIINYIKKTPYKQIIKDINEKNIINLIKTQKIYQIFKKNLLNKIDKNAQNILELEEIDFKYLIPLLNKFSTYKTILKTFENILKTSKNLSKIIENNKKHKKIIKLIIFYFLSYNPKITKEEIEFCLNEIIKKNKNNIENTYIMSIVLSKYYYKLINLSTSKFKVITEIINNIFFYSILVNINKLYENKELEYWENEKEYEKNILSVFSKKNKITKILSEITNKEKKTVFDFGCGPGNSIKHLLDFKEIYAIDFSKNMLDITKKKYPNLKKLKLYQKNLKEKINFKKKADVSLAISSIFPKNDKEFDTIIKNILNNTKEKSLILITLPSFESSTLFLQKRIQQLNLKNPHINNVEKVIRETNYSPLGYFITKSNLIQKHWLKEEIKEKLKKYNFSKITISKLILKKDYWIWLIKIIK
jgi:ubiquinone/menaquinone biosynthesis C-methylase UbiE